MSSVDESNPGQQPGEPTIVNRVDRGNKKKWYLLISNPSKTTHLGTLLRCAAAFQCHQVLLVGYDKFNCQGSFGSHLFLDIVVFPTWESVQDYLRKGGDVEADRDDNYANNENKRSAQSAFGDGPDSMTDETSSTIEGKKSHDQNPVTIIGLLGAYGGGEDIFSPDGATVYEDEDSFASLVPAASCLPQKSHPIHTRQFSGDVCFLLSKDKRGLPLLQAQLCSSFAHVPHLAFDNDASPIQEPSSSSPQKSSISQSSLIDTATSISIVLHHFTAWAGYEERTFAENQKFVKDIKPNNRRRLCRIFGQTYDKKETNNNNTKTETLEDNTEEEAMASMALFNKTGDVSQSSDY